VLDIVAVAGHGWCADCNKTVTIHERPAACPDCGNVRVEVTGGDQMRLKELEVE
jgi:hydrogenase nickel incorporation protein HypA/HybF